MLSCIRPCSLVTFSFFTKVAMTYTMKGIFLRLCIHWSVPPSSPGPLGLFRPYGPSYPTHVWPRPSSPDLLALYDSSPGPGFLAQAFWLRPFSSGILTQALIPGWMDRQICHAASLHKMYITQKGEQGKGTAVHILSLDNWFPIYHTNIQSITHTVTSITYVSWKSQRSLAMSDWSASRLISFLLKVISFSFFFIFLLYFLIAFWVSPPSHLQILREISPSTFCSVFPLDLWATSNKSNSTFYTLHLLQ